MKRGVPISAGIAVAPAFRLDEVGVRQNLPRIKITRYPHAVPFRAEIERMAPGESPERLSRLVHYDRASLARIVRVARAIGAPLVLVRQRLD